MSKLKAALLFAFLGAIVCWVAPAENGYDGPLRLAKELLQGRTNLPEFLPYIEMFFHDGRNYLAYPPMVSFLVVPYVWLTGGHAGQPLFNSMLILGSAMLLYRLVRGLPGIERFALVSAFTYVLGTPILYSATNGNVWLLMHTEGSFLLLLALVFLIVWRRPLWAGFAFMAAAQARYVIVLSGIVFALLLLQQAPRSRGMVRGVLLWGGAFVAGTLPPLLAALAFQWWTLGDPLLSPYAAAWREWGLKGPQFSLDYFRRNLEIYTIAAPTLLPAFPYFRFDAGGQSMFVMSPFFLGLFLINLRFRWVWAFLPGALAMIVFYLLYFGTGYAQFGTRYMQDIYPLLIPLALSGFSRPGRAWRIALGILVAVGVAMNVYGVYVTRYL